MSGAIMDPSSRLRARAIFEKLAEVDNRLSLDKAPEFLHLMFGNSWDNASDDEKEASLASFKAADKDGTGLPFVAILRVLAASLDADFVAKIREQFAKLDLNGDGFATMEEIMAYFKGQGINMDAKNVQHFIKSFDRDGDGRINMEEFIENVMVSPLATAVGGSLTQAIERAFVEVEEDAALQDVRRELLEEFEMFEDAGHMTRDNAKSVLGAQGVTLSDEDFDKAWTKVFRGGKVEDTIDREQWLFLGIQAFTVSGGINQSDSAFQEARRAFSIFDTDNNGFVEGAELESVLLREVDIADNSATEHRQKEVKELVKAMDTDGNGQIDLSEFVLFCMNATTARIKKTGAVDDRMEM